MKRETAIKNFQNLQSYFVQKILNKEYEIMSSDAFRAKLCIDGLFYFSFWIGNDGDYCRQNQDYEFTDSMELPLLDIKYRKQIFEDLTK